MDFNVTIDENKYLTKFFNKYEQYEDRIKNNIFNVLPDIIENRPYKIKPAYDLKYHNQTIYEYKIVLDKNLNFRAAYIKDYNNILIIFISNILIKREFVKLLKNTTLVD